MKKMIKIFALASVIFAFSVNTFAQATASASAVIMTPLSITRITDLHFGSATVSAAAGTILLTPAGVRTASGGVTLQPTAPTFTVASFTVAGQLNTAYTISLPASVTIDEGALHTMLVNTFASNPNATGNLGATGSQTLTVGATLNVNGSQTPGSYTSNGGPFTVTVNYN
jgi:phage tail sheath protein FI